MSEERYIEWLERLELPVSELIDIEHFQKYLSEQLELSDTQIDALTDAYDFERESLFPYGITPISITYPWGEETRYVIKGYSGLWGWERTKEIAEEEGWF